MTVISLRPWGSFMLHFAGVLRSAWKHLTGGRPARPHYDVYLGM